MSSLLYRVITAHRCRSTHHFIAIDALNLLEGDTGAAWRDCLLTLHEDLLEGAKAPDTKFKDFKNHVLHVSEGEWGGARDSAMEWYAKAVDALRNKKWPKAAYALGVMSHYYADPIQPFHTGQTEEEGAIHRAVEWSIAKSRPEIERRMADKGFPKVEAGSGVAFVSDMVRAGAERSHQHYQTFIDHYNVDAGVKNPPEGLDDTLLDILADLVGYATAGLATIYARAFQEAAVSPPKSNITLHGYLSSLDIPIRWITKKMEDGADKQTVLAMYRELQKTGKVVKSLPDDDKQIRKMHAQQVLRKPIKELNAQPLKPLGEKHVPREAPVQAEVDEKPVSGKKQDKTSAAIVKLRPTPEEAPELYERQEEVVEEVETVALNEAPVVDEVPHVEEIDTVEDTETVEDIQAAETIETETPSLDDAIDDAEPVETEDYAELDEPFEDTSEDAYEAQIDDLEATESIEEEDEDTYATQDWRNERDNDVEMETDDTFEDEDEQDWRDQRDELIESEAEEETESEPKFVAEQATPEPDEKPASTSWRRELTLHSPIEAAPSIGAKTAARLEEVGIFTVEDLLECDIYKIAEETEARYITPDTLQDWCDQTQLMLDVPSLRVHDAQILVGAGVRTVEELAEASTASLLDAATNFLNSPEGERAVRGDHQPDEEEVDDWIESALEACM